MGPSTCFCFSLFVLSTSQCFYLLLQSFSATFFLTLPSWSCRPEWKRTRKVDSVHPSPRFLELWAAEAENAGLSPVRLIRLLSLWSMHYFAQTVVFFTLKPTCSTRHVMLLWNEGLNKRGINKLLERIWFFSYRRLRGHLFSYFDISK